MGMDGHKKVKVAGRLTKSDPSQCSGPETEANRMGSSNTRVRGKGRVRELLSLGMIVGAVMAVVALLPDFGGINDPPRWSTLPWTRLPNAFVMALHHAGRIFPWIAAAGVWALAASVGWSLHRRLNEADTDAAGRLSFDVLSVLVTASAVSFTRGLLQSFPKVVTMDGATSIPFVQWSLFAIVMLISVLAAVVLWWLVRRATPHPAAAVAALTLACYLPHAILRTQGNAWTREFLSRQPLFGATAISVGTAVILFASFILFGLLSGTAARIGNRFGLILDRLTGQRSARAAGLAAVGAILVLPVVLALAQFSWIPEESLSRAPNIVLIVVDTLRSDHLGVYGYSRPTSPQLDAWADKGTVFRYAYSASSYTTPGVAGMMASRYSTELGIVSVVSRLPRDTPTLARILSGRGYQTAAFVGNYVLRRALGFQRGFEVYDDYFPETEAVHGLPERAAHGITDAAIEWLDHGRSDRPVFLWLHYQDPHGPYLPPPDASRVFNAADYEANPVDPAKIPPYQLAEGLLQAESFLAGYDNEIHYLDGHLGRLLRRLQAVEAERPTFVVFTADHGEILDEPMQWNFAHGKSLSDEEVHVPLVFTGPGIEGGRFVDGPVSTLDLVPTLLAIAGLTVENEWRGENLLPVLTGGGEPNPDRVVIAELLRTYRLKLAAWNTGGSNQLELSLGPTGAILPSDEAEEALAEPFMTALTNHRRWIENHGRDGTQVPVSRTEKERLRSLGYVE